MSENPELYVDRGRDGAGEDDIRYRSYCVGHELPTPQPQTNLYTLPPNRLIYNGKGTPLPPAMATLDLPQILPSGEVGPLSLHRGSWPRESNQGPPE